MAGTRLPNYSIEFLTRRQIAEVAGVPHRVVDRWIATGQLTPIRMSLGLGRGGQRVFYSAADVHKCKLAAQARPRHGRRFK